MAAKKEIRLNYDIKYDVRIDLPKTLLALAVLAAVMYMIVTGDAVALGRLIANLV